MKIAVWLLSIACLLLFLTASYFAWESQNATAELKLLLVTTEYSQKERASEIEKAQQAGENLKEECKQLVAQSKTLEEKLNLETNKTESLQELSKKLSEELINTKSHLAEALKQGEEWKSKCITVKEKYNKLTEIANKVIKDNETLIAFDKISKMPSPLDDNINNGDSQARKEAIDFAVTKLGMPPAMAAATIDGVAQKNRVKLETGNFGNENSDINDNANRMRAALEDIARVLKWGF